MYIQPKRKWRSYRRTILVLLFDGQNQSSHYLRVQCFNHPNGCGIFTYFPHQLTSCSFMNLGISKTQQFTSLNSAYCFRSFPMKHDLFTSTEAIWGCRIVYPIKSKTKGLDLSTVHHLQSFQLQGRPFHSQKLSSLKVRKKLDESWWINVPFLHPVVTPSQMVHLQHFATTHGSLGNSLGNSSVSKSWSTPIAGGRSPAIFIIEASWFELLFCFHQIRKLSPCFVGFIPQAFKLYSAICR